MVPVALHLIVTIISFSCLAWFLAPATVYMRSTLFWEVTWRRLVVIYRNFEKTYRSHCQGSSPSGLLMKGQIVFRQVTSHLRCLIYQKGKDITSSIIYFPSRKPIFFGTRFFFCIFHNTTKKVYCLCGNARLRVEGCSYFPVLIGAISFFNFRLEISDWLVYWITLLDL
jgi:hypothetical protein